MGWQPNGTVLRRTDDGDGNNPIQGVDVWQQDQQAGTKVIASRHDVHDEDLAVAISEALNINGLNEMAAALDAGNFKVVNIAQGTLAADGVSLDQLIASASFDNPSRNLTLAIPGMSDIVVNIPSGVGAGGGGTITEITVGEGLASDVNPITVEGTISLPDLGVGQTISNGIASLTVDKHGRITNLVQGAFANTNLSIGTRTSTRLQLLSSTGTDVDIPLSSGSQAGIITADQFNKIQALSGFKYAKGNWTPTMGAATEDGDNYGRYIRIGDMVYIWANVSWSARTSSSNAFEVAGLPFDVSNAVNSSSNSPFVMNYVIGDSPSIVFDPSHAGAVAIEPLAGSWDTLVVAQRYGDNSFGGTTKHYTYADMPSNGNFRIAGAYQTNDP